MNTRNLYDPMATRRSTLSDVFDHTLLLDHNTLEHKQVGEMIMLLGMMPLEDIKLDKLSVWGNVGYDLILNTPRLRQHSKYQEFVRTHFCAACRELRPEQVARFAPYASETDQLEGFLFVLMESVSREAQVFPPQQQTTFYAMSLGVPHDSSDKREEIVESLINSCPDTVLSRVSETLHMQSTAVGEYQPEFNHFWAGCSQKIQNEILKRTTDDASAQRDPTVKRKM